MWRLRRHILLELPRLRKQIPSAVKSQADRIQSRSKSGARSIRREFIDAAVLRASAAQVRYEHVASGVAGDPKRIGQTRPEAAAYVSVSSD
jgi:hypothetical protein